MSATLSRSDVLKPLIWPIAILATLTVAAAIKGVPDWLIVTFIVLTGLAVALYLAAYLFCLFVDRDSLRSESYSLHKMALEQGLYGDSAMGLIDPSAHSGGGGTAVVVANAPATPTSKAP